MAVEFNFYLSDSDFQKLRLLKRVDDKQEDMTYNDYAEEILSRTIRRMYREYDRERAYQGGRRLITPKGSL